MINLKTTENSIKLLTKGKYCDDDINVTFEGGSGGGGIEEVTELPVASAENVGKIYKYQGQLYECKEVKGLYEIYSDGATLHLFNLIFFGANANIHYVDSEPNVEDMLVSDIETMIFEMYVLNDGTNALVALDLGEGVTKMPYAEVMEMQFRGLESKFPKVDETNEGLYLIHFYNFEQMNSDVTNMLLEGSIDTQLIVRVPKKVTCLQNNAFHFCFIKEVIFEGNIYNMYVDNIVGPAIIDLSNVEFVPNLFKKDNTTIKISNSIIKVPQALLEDFKTATNWSEYADLMVGV